MQGSGHSQLDARRGNGNRTSGHDFRRKTQHNDSDCNEEDEKASLLKEREDLAIAFLVHTYHDTGDSKEQVQQELNIGSLDRRRKSSLVSIARVESGDENHRREASWLELFYDLFYVANLNTFTSEVHLINLSALLSYSCFFAIMWITWISVALYDVRFSRDCLFDRLCKGFQFTISVVFYSIGVRYHLDQESFEPAVFSTLALFLSVSKAVLGVQYAVVLLYMMKSKQDKHLKQSYVKGLALTCAMYVVSSIVHAGLVFPFHGNHHSYAYIGFFVCSGFEMGLTLCTSLAGPVTMFHESHIIQRLGLFTLILLGEGILKIGNVIGHITISYYWSRDLTYLTFAGVMCIYTIWMIFFDGRPDNQCIPKKQIFWIVMHFPLHLAMVLFVEGVQQVLVAGAVKSIIQGLYHGVLEHESEYTYPNGTTNGIVIFNIANATTFGARLFADEGQSRDLMVRNLDLLYSSQVYSQSVDDFVAYLMLVWMQSIFLDFNSVTQFTNFGQVGTGLRQVGLCASYTCCAVGIVLIILGYFRLLHDRKKDSVDYFSAISRTFFGLSVLIFGVQLRKLPLVDSLLDTGFLLPAITGILVFVFVIDQTIVWVFLYRVRKKKDIDNNVEDDVEI